MAAAFLPMQYGIWTLLGIILVISIVPVVYSYCFYRKQLAQGTLSPAKKAEPSRAQKIATAVLIALTIIFLAVVLFTGKITCTFSDNSFTISGSGAGSLTVDYDQITSITLTEEDISGQRVFGIANHRILAGSFHSDALGDYTRYTYCNSELYILISAGDKILLLNGENPEQTQDIYKQILSHLDEPMDLGITLTAENVTPTGLTLICQQSGGSFTGELTTGSAFTLQKYENGQWIPVESNGDIFWTMEAWLIPQNDTITWDVNWEHIYGSLTPGQYRIGKIFTAFRSAGNCDEATIYAEFEIR